MGDPAARGRFEVCRECRGDGEVSHENLNRYPVGCLTCGQTGIVLDGHAVRQMDEVRRRWPKATLSIFGARNRFILRVPEIKLPKKIWQQKTATVLVDVPVGFPCASPQHFYCETPITLHSGGWPQHSMSPIYQSFNGVKAEQWHMLVLADWNPNKCTLMTYVNVCRQRFQIAR